MKKVTIFLFLVLIICNYCYSQDIEVTINVTNITVNGGKVYLVFFTNADSFKKENPEFAFELPDSRTSATQTVTIPSGEYVVSAFQDTNNNQKVDYNLVGIPKELLGISNYPGRGFPSRDFNKQKIRLDSTTGTVTLPLYKF